MTLPFAHTTAWTGAPCATALHGTRIEDPAITRARLLPHVGKFGITRVANVTGLDRLGIPVYMAIRPNSRSLSVSQGKGVTDDAAWVSGVMEAIELWHAEEANVRVRVGSYAELSSRARVIDVDRLPKRRGSPYHPHHRMLWAEATELYSGQPVHVPYALVHVNSVTPFPPGDECFFVTSNGLASGSIREEALIHSLCEIVERDAVSAWYASGNAAQTAGLIDLSTIDEPMPAELLDLCERGAFDVLAFHVPSTVGLPVVVAVILDREESSETLRGAAMGFGCHLRRGTAFMRALTEAAQSRLTLIAGSRDDLVRQDYEIRRRHRDGIESYRALLRHPHPVDFRTMPDYDSVVYEEQIEYLLRQLRGAGVQEVAVIDLTTSPGDFLSVVRTIVPGLRGPDHAV